jgi:glycine cleavage system transcriptional repressor
MNKAILSVLGQDRPGIVAAISKILFQQNCNIENVSQTSLQSEFAGIFIVAMPAALSLETLKSCLIDELQRLDMHVQIKPLQPQDPGGSSAKFESFVITTKGPDRKGLVAGITEVIASHGANITNLQAVFKGGEDPGDNIMIYEVDVPSHVEQKILDHQLRQRAQELSLEISIQHRYIFEAINRI